MQGQGSTQERITNQRVKQSRQTRRTAGEDHPFTTEPKSGAGEGHARLQVGRRACREAPRRGASQRSPPKKRPVGAERQLPRRAHRTRTETRATSGRHNAKSARESQGAGGWKRANNSPVPCRGKANAAVAARTARETVIPVAVEAARLLPVAPSGGSPAGDATRRFSKNQ